MELKPRLRLRRPMEMPLRRPKRTTVLMSIGLFSKKFSLYATWSVQYVTIKCQLVSVVAVTKPYRKRSILRRIIGFLIKILQHILSQSNKEENSNYQKGNQDWSSKLCCKWQWRQKMQLIETMLQSHPFAYSSSLPFFLPLSSQIFKSIKWRERKRNIYWCVREREGLWMWWVMKCKVDIMRFLLFCLHKNGWCLTPNFCSS